MTVAQAVWPPTDPGNPRTPFTVLLVAEGFTAGQEDNFAWLCGNFSYELLQTAPFSLLRSHPERIAIWRLFTPSAQSGPALGSTPGTTVLGSTYDPASNTLGISATALQSLLDSSNFPVLPDQLGLGYLSSLGLPYRPGLVAVLTPATAGGTPILTDLDVDLPDTELAPSYVVVPVSPGWENVLIRGIARGFGLGDEFTLPDPAHAGLPPAGVSDTLDMAPNLYVADPPPGPPPVTFKWFRELGKDAITGPLTVVPYGGQSPTPLQPIQLFEGAGGYRAGVYRSAEDCFMRRQIGGAQASGDGGTPRLADVTFCQLCQRALVRAINGTEKLHRPPSFNRQLLMVDQVSGWVNQQVVTTFPVSKTFTGQTTRPAPWWEFTLAAGHQIESGYDGMLITNLVLQGQGDQSHAMPPVAQRIEFRDIVAVLDNGDVAPFDFTAAFSAANGPVMEISTDGVVDGTDQDVLYGIKLTLTSSLQGRCRVTLELSLTLKGGMPGADPVRAIYAAKLFPQIALTWHQGGTNTVKRFRGSVRMVFNNQVMPMQMAMPELAALLSGTSAAPAGSSAAPAAASAAPTTVTSFFTDSTGFPVGRRVQVKDGASEPLLPYVPIWSILFDYYKPNMQVETEIVGVYGPLAASAKRVGRNSGRFSWPPTATLPPAAQSGTLSVDKATDQAAYDNVHLHGSMGNDPVAPTGPMVHAPGCAEACIHIHWRWGLIAGMPNFEGMNQSAFWGWPRIRLSRSEPHCVPVLPLIPANQDLTITMAHPATVRSSPLGSVIQQSGVALDPAIKAVWYTADISGTLPAERRQVIFEQGASFAYRYNWDSSNTLKLWVRWLRKLPYMPTGLSDETVLHLGYSYLRWFLDSTGHPYLDSAGNPVSSQVPTGDFVPPSGTSLEAM
jgi:hypothetical protein